MTTLSKCIPAAATDFIGHGDFGAATAARSLQGLVAQSCVKFSRIMREIHAPVKTPGFKIQRIKQY